MQKELQDVLLCEIKQIVKKHIIAHMFHIRTIQQKDIVSEFVKCSAVYFLLYLDWALWHIFSSRL